MNCVFWIEMKNCCLKNRFLSRMGGSCLFKRQALQSPVTALGDPSLNPFTVHHNGAATGIRSENEMS